jgi:hypothetical protein
MIGIITKRNNNGTFDEVGMKNRYLTRGTSIRSITKNINEDWIKDGVRVEFFFDDSLYNNPFKVAYYNCPDIDG